MATPSQKFLYIFDLYLKGAIWGGLCIIVVKSSRLCVLDTLATLIRDAIARLNLGLLPPPFGHGATLTSHVQHYIRPPSILSYTKEHGYLVTFVLRKPKFYLKTKGSTTTLNLARL